MNKTFSVVGLALAVCVSSVAASYSLANAQDIQLQIGKDGIKPVIRDNRNRDRCGEREARAAARDSGLRDPEVVRVTDRRVVVEGMTRRGPERITFANVSGCPEI